ncbi:CaiB/BaiF CoA transferase family protein [Phreatobacter stygius]|uniref:CoA transferase n=1 Tax=Phreatobacter stygius TaxID=1940610 RepID=A0A4D7AYF9_9HYPH|nr:CoA transferase [Phreatobacter stygius]QCI65301.1 CoA transferase [Phreatobacter stygius]
MGPIAGIKIIDMTSVLMGPYATQMLADMGADVIKVEAPEGDLTRQIGPFRHDGMGAIYLNANRNKRSICLDLKHPDGRDALKRLAADADVLVYNVRPQAMARLGLDYETIAAINPRIIYAGVFGFGQDGPYAAKPAYDDLIQGGSTMSALIARSGDGIPRYVPTAVADRVVGLTAVGAICATLVHRERTGRGQRLDVPMFETMVGFVLGDHLSGLSFDPPLDRGGYARQLSPERRPYKTSDGHVCALVYNDKQWTSFLSAVGRSDLPERDPRFASFANRSANIDFVYGALAELFETKTTAEWLALLEQADVPAMPMHDVESVLDDPHLVATDFFQMVDHPTEGRMRTMRMATTWSETPAEIGNLAPRKGEQGVEILAAAGFDPATIQRLIDTGVVSVPAPVAPSKP